MSPEKSEKLTFGKERKPVNLVSFVLDNPYKLEVPESVKQNLKRLLNESPELVARLIRIQRAAESPLEQNRRAAAAGLENFISDLKAILEG